MEGVTGSIPVAPTILLKNRQNRGRSALINHENQIAGAKNKPKGSRVPNLWRPIVLNTA